MVNDDISISEWFDPYNHEHMVAYRCLCDTGMWPVDFIPDNIYLPPGWQMLVINKMADAWLEYMTEKHREILQ